MMNTRTAALGSVVALAMTLPAVASADNYFSVSGAYTMVDDSDFSVAPGTVTTEFDDGAGLILAFGKKLGTTAGGTNRFPHRG